MFRLKNNVIVFLGLITCVVILHALVSRDAIGATISEIAFTPIDPGGESDWYATHFKKDLWPIGTYFPSEMNISFEVGGDIGRHYRIRVEYSRVVSQRRQLPDGRGIDASVLDKTAKGTGYMTVAKDPITLTKPNRQFVYKFPLIDEMFKYRPPEEWLYAMVFRVTVEDIGSGLIATKSAKLTFLPDNSRH